MKVTEKLKSSKRRILESNICSICKNPLIKQTEYNLKDYDVIVSEGCLHCNIITKFKLVITKEDIDLHVKQLLDNNICGTCNKNVIIDDIEVCNQVLVIFIYIRCLHCKAHYIIVKPCDTKEELNKLLIEKENVGSLIKGYKR